MRLRCIAATVVLFLVVAVGGRAQSNQPKTWPGLWGPLRNADVPAWRAPAPLVAQELWRRPSAGGYSEIAVAGGLAVTTELRNGLDFVVALDPSIGRERWSARLGPTYHGHDGSRDGPIATPTIDAGDVFAVGPNGDVVALDQATGKERWRHNLVREFGAAVPGWGYGSSPLVEGTLVILPTGGPNSRGLLAFDRATGRLAWSAPHTKSLGYSSAVSASIAGARQIVVAGGDRIFAVSPEGRQLWSVPGPGAEKEIANSPLVLPDDRVLLTFPEEALLLKVSQRGGVFTAAEVWRSPALRNANGPTIYRDGFLYGFGGPQLICMNAATGNIRWRERTDYATLVGLGPQLGLLGATSGDLRLLLASPEGFKENFRTRVFPPGVVSVTGPSLADGRVYVRNVREMAAFSLGGVKPLH